MAYMWDAEAHTVLELGARGQLRILGGPGTGKSSLLIDAAVAQIDAGVDPESVLLLTGSGRIGMAERSALTTALLRSRPAARPGRGPRAVGADRAQLRVRGLAARRRTRRRGAPAAGHQRRTGRHHPGTAGR